MDNLFADLPRTVPAERVDVLVREGRMRLERIVSTGHATPPGEWYDQDAHEWVTLLAGSAGVRFEDSGATVALRPGDHLLIAPHRRHRVDWTDPHQPTVWLALHY
jgi:cupin 2 domain-containing protein